MEERRGQEEAAAAADRAAAQRLLVKLRDFAARQLEGRERELFASLVAPGIAHALDPDDVQGYGTTSWGAWALPDALAQVLRDSDLRVSGLDD